MAARQELFDLHVHSIRSDGLRSPMELAQLARLSGLSGIAITDHDILPDANILKTIETNSSVEMILGVELSTHWHARGLHLLAYQFHPDAPPLRELVSRILDQRRQRWDWYVDRLRAAGVKLDRQRLDRHRNQSSPGRVHLARELVAVRRATSLSRAFAKYLEPLAADAPRIGVDLQEAIATVHEAGGVAILAHPPTGMAREEWLELAQIGLDGIETRFGRVAGGHKRFLDERVAEYGWVATAGSDYHGDGAKNLIGSHHINRPALERLFACSDRSRQNRLASPSQSCRP